MPTLEKIISKLAINCDQFFDQLAERNMQALEEEARKVRTAAKEQEIMSSGLSKRVFFNLLKEQGIELDEDEKTMLSQVFGVAGKPDRFNYEMLDKEFEAVQQKLYAQGKCICV